MNKVTEKDRDLITAIMQYNDIYCTCSENEAPLPDCHSFCVAQFNAFIQALADARAEALEAICADLCEGCRLAGPPHRDRHGILRHKEPMPVKCTAAAIRARGEDDG